MKLLSFVIPCYASSKTIEDVVKEIIITVNTLNNFIYEIVLVNDNSPDNVYNVIKKLCEDNNNIKAINLSKNFGQHSAIMAGLNNVNGDFIILLDDDGQTPIDEIGKFIEKLEEGYDVVYGKYTHKKHSIFRNLGSRINDIMAEILIGKPKNLYVSSYFACKRFIIDEIINYKNPYPYLYGLIFRTSNNITNVEVQHRSRVSGKSGYTFSKLISLWLNGFTAFSVKPLRMATITGIFISFIGFISAIYIILKKVLNPEVPVGWSSLISVQLIIGGIILFMLGLIGEYIGRIYISINNSPQYVIKEKINIDEENKNE